MCRKPKTIKIDQCVSILQEEFSQFKDPRVGISMIPLQDFLMASYAIFALKYPSLLNFEKSMREDQRKENLKSLFGLSHIPSDTHLRSIMDQINPDQFRIIFKKLFADVQRSKLFERYEFMRINNRPHYLLSCDGSGYFRSDKIECDACIQYEGSEQRKLSKFGHNMLGSSFVHPDLNEVIPLCPELIIVQDGCNKNDCEQNAFKRFVADFRREHCKLDVIVTLDALYATSPVINLLFKNDCSFIIAVKETKGALYLQVGDDEKNGEAKHLEYSYVIGDKVKKTVIHKYRYTSNVRLGQDMQSPKVNFVEFWEETSWQGKRGPELEKRHFAWVTDLAVNQETVIQIMKGGRARWKIENEAFNTLKNQGYHLEHNYGHGEKHLSTNFIMMMFVAFFIDQMQLASCARFQKAIAKFETKKRTWVEMVSIFKLVPFENWDHYFQCLLGEGKLTISFVTNTE